jgi:hypothetical protein
MRLGGFDGRNYEFHFSEFIDGDHLYLSCRRAYFRKDSRRAGSKKDFETKRLPRPPEGEKLPAISLSGQIASRLSFGV